MEHSPPSQCRSGAGFLGLRQIKDLSHKGVPYSLPPTIPTSPTQSLNPAASSSAQQPDAPDLTLGPTHPIFDGAQICWPTPVFLVGRRDGLTDMHLVDGVGADAAPTSQKATKTALMWVMVGQECPWAVVSRYSASSAVLYVGKLAGLVTFSSGIISNPSESRSGVGPLRQHCMSTFCAALWPHFIALAKGISSGLYPAQVQWSWRWCLRPEQAVLKELLGGWQMAAQFQG